METIPTDTDQTISQILNPRRVALVLSGIVTGLALAHVAISVPLPIKGISIFRKFFNMRLEANLPAYISALNLLLAGGLLTIIARHESKRQGRLDWHWWGLAVGLLLMSFDEAAMIHEGIVGSALMKVTGRGEGVFYTVWYLPYIPLVLLIGAAYIPFLRRLPRRYVWGFIASGVIYLGGAIGAEMIGSYIVYHELSGVTAIIVIEETFEMLGVVLLIYTLLTYLSEAQVKFQVKFAP